MSRAGQGRVGKNPRISSRRNHVSRTFWQGGSRRFLRDSLWAQKVCECMCACIVGGPPPAPFQGGDSRRHAEKVEGRGKGGLSGLIFLGLFLTFC